MARGNKPSMETFFLSYVNETVFALELPFFKMVSPKTNFFSFSNLGLIITQQTSIYINCFMAGGWHTSCHAISKMHIAGEGPGETPSALRCRGWGGTLRPSSDVCQKLSLCLFILIKICYAKILEWSKLVPGPKVKYSSWIWLCSP